MTLRLLDQDNSIILYGTVAILMSMLGVAAIWFDTLWLMLIPLVLIVFLYLLSGTTISLYGITAFLIPFSTELDLPGGIGLVFPGELMFLLLTVVGLITMITRDRPKELYSYFTVFIILHLFWIAFTAIFAEYPLISFKYWLAKIWFIVPFYFLPFYSFRDIGDFDRVLRALFWASVLAALYVFVRHGLEGWTFASRPTIAKPFFRNHVNYACLLLMVLPISIYLYRRTKSYLYVLLVPVLLACIYVTYARIAYVSILAMIVIYVLYHLRLIRTVVTMSAIGLIFACFYFISGDRLLHFAPDYETTVSHSRFDRLLEASVELKDISAMERAHRWMAGVEMIKDRPWLGFGPSNFYSCYQPYSINSFQTYVSDNPEQSGIHNYFLMVLVEQGFIGLAIFLIIILASYWKVTALRADHISSPLVMLSLSWMTGIVIILMLNDMIEVVKLGPFFFMALWAVNYENVQLKS